ncbi:threonine/serine ThrE exporter family protein [Knoellia koreensis]|jgi:uncharacterized membrane protein YjjP (DUF1212 family)|uniref:Threonine/serine exporter family protein n=1 Tax=Knoellia koreensis TaxID=2730921 RepID=A0A849HKL3_9MICO|nr:threonine/serine exporter family protein [Knoellia sp. DB2414S]NNM46881.1 threonine/serine exporter family protein [Knoellia sp. DB2414S]
MAEDRSHPHRRRPVLRQSRIWRGEEMTETMPMVETLRNTPYRNAKVRQAVAEEREARASLDLALRVGELMLRCGADAPQVEASVVAVAAAAGLDNLEVDITLQSLLVQCTTPSGVPITMLRVVRSSTRDFARLVAVHEFVEELVGGEYDREAASARLREIRRAPRFWPRWVVRGAPAVTSGAIALMLGAGVVAAVVSAVSSLLIGYAVRKLSRFGVPEFYQSALGGFLATVLAWGAFAVGAQSWLPVSSTEFAFMVAGGITVLLPGRVMASAFEDAISGYSVTGAGRVFGVLLTTSAIILGVATGLAVTLQLGRVLDLELGAPSILSSRAADAPFALAMVGAAIVGVSGAVSLRSRRRLVLPAGALSLAATVVSLLVSRVEGAGLIASAGVAAVVLGAAGRLVALRLGAPAMVLIVPASYALLPGLAIFRGLYQLFGSGADAGTLTQQGGITTLLGAMATLLAIAAGSVFGEFLAAPFDHRMVQKRRVRSR